jgi:lipid-A-disaccharide synthase
MPIVNAVIETIGPRYRHLLPRASTIAREMLSEGERIGRYRIVESTFAALAPARSALVKSGTSTVETALLGVPFAMFYRTSPVTYQIARRAIKVPWLSMVNILAGRQVVREFIQNQIDPVTVAGELLSLSEDSEYRARIVSGIDEVRRLLGGPGAPKRTAEHIVERWL